MHILHVVGARPNFMKVAPVMRALRTANVRQTLVHTGQHYDAQLPDVFFQELKLSEPDVNLAVGSGTHGQQTGEIMIRLEPVVLERKPDWVLVYGDVNSTAAAALVCAKLGVQVAHVEAGLRSFDRQMPEEINRLITDQIADLLLTPSLDGNANLLREGIAPSRVYFVGNVMIDTLIQLLPSAAGYTPRALPARYALVTLHRPANVDEPGMLRELFSALEWLSRELDVFFPVHPRTAARLQALGLLNSKNHRPLHMCAPMSYLQFLAMQQRATVVLTDSGGVQEETTYLGVPCLTLRDNTERPITVELGTNVLVGSDMRRLRDEVENVLNGKFKTGQTPPLWDGQASKRIAEILVGTRADVDLVGSVASIPGRGKVPLQGCS
jgi:UDP-N-acetylglucosamine 2-epimerase (non-hydrolysing)